MPSFSRYSILCRTQVRRNRVSINLSDVVRADLFTHISGQLIEEKYVLLPATVLPFRLRIVLVAADDEPVRKIREQLKPLRLDFAIRSKGVIQAMCLGIGLDFHI